MRSQCIFNRQNLLYGLIFYVSSSLGLGALAQATNQAIYLPPQQSSQGAAPPPGDGSTAAPVTPGDAQPQNVITGPRKTAEPVQGTYMEYANPKRRGRIKLFMNGKQVLVFQPDQLTQAQQSKVMGIVGGVQSDTPYQDVNVTQDQLIEIQNALAPSPDVNAGISDVSMPDGRERSQIFTDSPAGNTLSQNGTYDNPPKLLIIQKFCRYLVILGAVCACIFIAFASISLIFGDRSASGRIIGSVSGLMILFMAFAIWKVVRFNEDNARGPTNRVVIGKQQVLETRSSAGDIKRVKSDESFSSLTNANLPVTPPNPGGIQRSGLTLSPLGSAH